jgi:hypothetical protein
LKGVAGLSAEPVSTFVGQALDDPSLGNSPKEPRFGSRKSASALDRRTVAHIVEDENRRTVTWHPGLARRRSSVCDKAFLTFGERFETADQTGAPLVALGQLFADL